MFETGRRFAVNGNGVDSVRSSKLKTELSVWRVRTAAAFGVEVRNFVLTLLVEKAEVEGDRTVVVPLFNDLGRNLRLVTLEGRREFDQELQKDIVECISLESRKSTREYAV